MLPPADVYGMNGSVAYTLYAENFAGSCWGERINAAITHAIEHGNGSGIVQLPPGDLNVSTPIRFARTARGDPCVQLNATRSIAAVWGCSHGATQADLPRGLTLLGTGGTSGVEMNARMEENTEAKEGKNPAAAAATCNDADDAGEGAGDRSNDAPNSR